MATATTAALAEPPTPGTGDGGQAGWKIVAIGAAVVVLATFGFFLLFFNRFAGIRMGNAAGLGHLVSSGPRPDHSGGSFGAVPPLYGLENALWMRLFGPSLILSRIIGVVGRVIMAVILYLWLNRVFRTSSAVLGAIVAIVVSAGDVSDPIASYNHNTLLWAVVAGFLASICLDWRKNKTSSLAAFLSGIAAGLCLCDKQTIGLGISVAVPVLVVASLWKARGFRLASRFAAWFWLGWAVPVGAIAYRLLSKRALGRTAHQIFVSAPSAKAAHPMDFLIRWIEVTSGQPLLRYGFVVAAVLLVLTLKLLLYPNGLRETPARRGRMIGLVALLSLVSIGGGAVAAYAGLTPWGVVVKASIYFTLLACGLVATVLSLGFLAGRLSAPQRQFWLLATVGFVCAFMLALSWPAFEAMVFPGLGFLAAALLDLPSKRVRTMCYGACAILLFSLVVWKLWNPWAFGEWSEPPVMAADTAPTLPALRGFRLPKSEVNILEGVARIVREHSTPNDLIFTYPTMPIFYEITHRWWPGLTADHNFDDCPDSIARADAATVLRVKPAVIIYYAESPKVIRLEELLWRDGHKSGQRAIIAAVQTLAKQYKLAAVYNVPTTKLKLDVYVRH